MILGFQGQFLSWGQGNGVFWFLPDLAFQDDQAFRADTMADRFFTVSNRTASLHVLTDYALAVGTYGNHGNNPIQSRG